MPLRSYRTVIPGSIPADGTVLRSNNKIRGLDTVGTSNHLAVVGDFRGNVALGTTTLTNNNADGADKSAWHRPPRAVAPPAARRGRTGAAAPPIAR